MKTALACFVPLLGPCLAVSAAGAQTLPEGYSDQTITLPPSAGNVLSMSAALTVWFDGVDLVLSGLGQQRSLLHFGVPVFGSFTLKVDSGTVLFAESSTHGLWLVDLNGPAPTQPLANLTLNYDAVLYRPQLALVSAKTAGFGAPDNDLVALDLQTGSTQLLARLPGASGPLAIGRNGDVYYATASLAFPTPPGQTDVLRLSRSVIDAALANNQVLGPAHAQVAVTGLDSAADLAFDDDGDLFFVDWYNSEVGEIDDADGPAPAHKTLVDYTTVTFGGVGLQFTTSTNAGVFEPFQPIGRTLRVHESSFGSLSQVRPISPRSASLTSTVPSPVPAGAFALQIADGPAGGFGFVALAVLGGPGSTQLQVPAFEQPLFWHQGLLQPAGTIFVGFDGSGRASLPLVNPGFAPLQGILSQAGFVDAPGATIGATRALALDLTQ